MPTFQNYPDGFLKWEGEWQNPSSLLTSSLRKGTASFGQWRVVFLRCKRHHRLRLFARFWGPLRPAHLRPPGLCPLSPGFLPGPPQLDLPFPTGPHALAREPPGCAAHTPAHVPAVAPSAICVAPCGFPWGRLATPCVPSIPSAQLSEPSSTWGSNQRTNTHAGEPSSGHPDAPSSRGH